MVVAAIHVVICMTLILSAFTHMNAPYHYLESIYNYHLLPESMVPAFASFTTALHMVVVAAVVTGRLAKPAYLVSTGIFSMYLVAQSIAMAKGLEIGCGCFGPASEVVGVGSISIVLSLVVASAFQFFVQPPLGSK